MKVPLALPQNHEEMEYHPALDEGAWFWKQCAKFLHERVIGLKRKGSPKLEKDENLRSDFRTVMEV